MVAKSNNALRLPPGALPVTATADYLGVSEPTVWRMLRDGTLPRIKLRGRTVIARSACDALLARSGAMPSVLG